MRKTLLRWPLTGRVGRQAEFMNSVLRHLQVDVAVAVRKDGGRAFTKARINCLLCRYCGSCRNWLDGVEGSLLSSGSCPNAGFFHELQSPSPARHKYDREQDRKS